MATTFDAKGTAASSAAGATSITDANLTVGATATALTYFCAFPLDGTTPESSVAATWDSGGTNQAMTLIQSRANSNGNGITVYVFGLLNPTTGNKTFKLTWTNSNSCVVFGVSWTGSITSSFANCFNHNAVSSNVSSNTSFISGSCTTTSNDIVAGIVWGTASSLTFSGLTGTNDLNFNTNASGFVSHGNASSSFGIQGTSNNPDIHSGVAVNIAGAPVPISVPGFRETVIWYKP